MPIKPETALRYICEQYPQIRFNDIEYFAPVYYPVAKIEVDMQERSFEDFDVVQKAVLRMISLGFIDGEMISGLMGLTPSYIESMKKLLAAYGHVDEAGRITELGRTSLNEGRKITEARIRQIFFLDAVNCTIVRLSKELDRTMLESPELSSPGRHEFVPFLDHVEGVSGKEIENTILQTEYKTLRRMPGSVNINVSGFNGVRCLGIRYVKSYFLKISGYSPMIFVKRYDFSRRDDGRHFWLPFSVSSQKERDFLEHRDLELHSVKAVDLIGDLQERLIAFRRSEYVEKEMRDKIDYFVNKQYRLAIDEDSIGDGYIQVVSDSITEYSGPILQLLNQFGRGGVSFVVDDNLAGCIIRFIPGKDKKLLECSKAIAKFAEEYTYPVLKQYMEEAMGKSDGKVVDVMLNVLRDPEAVRRLEAIGRNRKSGRKN